MNMYLLYKEESITKRKQVEFISSEEVGLDAMNSTTKDAIYRVGINLDNLDKILSAKAVVSGGHRYSEYEAVILGYVSDEYEIGLIEKVFHIRNEVYILSRVMKYFYNQHYHAYEITSIYNKFKLTEINNLIDYHPLGVYNIEDKLLITLKHYVKEDFLWLITLVLLKIVNNIYTNFSTYRYFVNNVTNLWHTLIIYYWVEV